MLRFRDSVRSLGMVPIHLADKTWPLLLEGLQLFEKVDHAHWIVAALVGVLYAQVISLGFEVAPKFTEHSRHSEVGGLAYAKPSQSARHHHHRNHGDAGQ